MIQNDATVFPPNGGVGYDLPSPAALIEAPNQYQDYDAPVAAPMAAPIEVRARPADLPSSGGIVANAPKVSQGGAGAAVPPDGPAVTGAPRVSPGAGAGLVDAPGAGAGVITSAGPRVIRWDYVILASLAVAGVLWFALADREDKRK